MTNNLKELFEFTDNQKRQVKTGNELFHKYLLPAFDNLVKEIDKSYREVYGVNK